MHAHIQCVHTLYTHCTHIVHTLCTHCTHIVHINKSTHIHIVHALYTHCTHIVHALYTHCTHIVHTLYTHCTHIVHTLYTLYTYTYVHISICTHVHDTNSLFYFCQMAARRRGRQPIAFAASIDGEHNLNNFSDPMRRLGQNVLDDKYDISFSSGASNPSTAHIA